MDQLVVITGLSGSGKSLAARCLEDLDFFCVDNLPVTLIPPFYDLIQRSREHIGRAALVIDIRERAFLEQFPDMIRGLRSKGVRLTFLFLECSDEVLKRRFSETRRPHPMQGEHRTLDDAIRREREALAPLRDLADRIIDTSRFTAHEIRSFLQSAFRPSKSGDSLNVHVVSFGFKYGVPTEADLVFDVRFLPNPYFVDELKALDGTSAEVRAFLADKKETGAFLKRWKDMVDFLLPLYAAEGKTYLTLTVGCTGGRHRSVALAEDLRDHLSERDVPVALTHRDLGRE